MSALYSFDYADRPVTLQAELSGGPLLPMIDAATYYPSGLLDPAGDRSNVYQDFQYFLSIGNGPWGNLILSFDQIHDGTRSCGHHRGYANLYFSGSAFLC